MAYLDFTLRIEADDSGCRVEVLDSPAGERAEHRFELPFVPGELAELAREHGRAVRAAGPLGRRHARPAEGPCRAASTRLDDAGRRLSDALFQGAVRDRFLKSVRAGSRLRIRLRFDLAQPGVARLHRVPWELLVSPDTRRPLALSRETPLVRYLEVARGTAPPPAPDALQVRLVAAQPAGTERLDLDGEERGLRAALGTRTTVALRRIEPPTLAGIVEALQEGGVHVLHVMGHGDVDPETGEGVLLLEDEHGRRDAVTARRFVTMAADFLRPLRLVFLNACRTAEASEAAPLAGFAPALVEEGLPAVVAMQRPITDGAAARFASAVYGSLAAAAPIDDAVTEGRLALWGEMGRSLPGLPEWATPALFLRVPDGRLFLPTAPAQAPSAGGEPTPAPRRARPWVASLVAAGALSAGVAGVAVWRGRSEDLHDPRKVPADFQAREAGMWNDASPDEEDAGSERPVPADPRQLPADLQVEGQAPADEVSEYGRQVPAELQDGGAVVDPFAGFRKVPAELQEPMGEGSEEVPSRATRGFPGWFAAPGAAPSDTSPKRSERGGDEPRGGALGTSGRDIADGASAEFPEAAAVVTVDFLSLQGESFVRLSVLHEGDPVRIAPAYGPSTIEFRWADSALSVDVLHVDWTARTVRLRVSR